MILLLSKLSFLSVMASSSVIYSKREIIHNQVQQETTRVKREVSDSREWVRICPTEVETSWAEQSHTRDILKDFL